MGSSPLARGPRTGTAGSQCPQRIIPARAGSTSSGSVRIVRDRDHPRSRGVHLRSITGRQSMTGSSPLARGPHQLPRSAGRIDGIIPARAGSTQPVCGTQKSGQDHPRSRGVHIRRLRCAVYQQGSSPLARGPLSMILLSHSPTRIIPARAGSTVQTQNGREKFKDHPRSRGVHIGWKNVCWIY